MNILARYYNMFFSGWFHRQRLSSLLQTALGRDFGNRRDGEKSGGKSGKVEKTCREQARGNINVLTIQTVLCLRGQTKTIFLPTL